MIDTDEITQKPVPEEPVPEGPKPPEPPDFRDWVDKSVRCVCGYITTIRRHKSKLGDPIKCKRCKRVGKSPFGTDEQPALDVTAKGEAIRPWEDPSDTEIVTPAPKADTKKKATASA